MPPFVIFIFTFFITLISRIQSCQSIPGLNFDMQEFLTWDYLATINRFPYKDFYYPYGIFYFFASNNIVFQIFNLLLPAVLFMLIYFMFKKLWGKSFSTYVTFFIFYLFSLFVVGLQNFSKYGILLVLSLFYVVILRVFGQLTLKTGFLLGVLCAAVFSLFFDQGIYAALLFFVFFPAIGLVEKRDSITQPLFYVNVIKMYLAFILGFAVVLIPFLLFLLLNGALNGFIDNVSTLQDVAMYAKTPFFPTLKSFNNLFITAVLSMSVSYLTLRLFVFKSRNLVNLDIILVLTTVIFMLEQKNVIRPIDNQLIPFAYVLFISLSFEVNRYIKKSNKFWAKYYRLFVILYLLLLVLPFHTLFLYKKVNINPVKSVQNLSLTSLDGKLCLAQRISQIKKNDRQYFKVINELKRYPDFNGKIYSFPGDPIFYVLLNQEPPFYSAIYEASPIYAQKVLIEFIEKKDIKYIVYNYKNTAIQDNVPNVARASYLYSYIKKNFSTKSRVGNFQILSRNETIKNN